MWTADVQRSLKRLLQAIWPPPRVERKRTFPATAKTERAPLPVAAKKDEAREPLPVTALSTAPRGWLSAVTVHGGATVARMCEYMKDHWHVLPYMDADFTAATFGRESDTQLDFTDSALWTEVTCEPCPPSLPGCGPTFFGPLRMQKEYAKSWSSDLDEAATGGVRGDFRFDAWTPFTFEPGVYRPWGTKGQYAVCFPGEWPFQFTKDWYVKELSAKSGPFSISADGTLADLSRIHPDEGGPTIRPAAAVVAWAGNWATHRRGAGRGADLAHGLLEPYRKNAVRIPAYWRESAKRRAAWWGRLCAWYHRAAWIVWAGECVRIHTQGTRPDPTWWKNHCICWGVGYTPKSMIDAKGIAKASATSSKRLSVSDPAELVEEFLRLIVEHTPVPGSPGTLGSQIVPDERDGSGRAKFQRHLLDMPDLVGAADPPYSMNWWRHFAICNWAKKAAKEQAGAFDVFAAIINAEASLCGAGFGSAVTSTLAAEALRAGASTAVSGLVSKVVNLALQGCWKMGMGGDPSSAWNWGDVVGLMGDVVNASGLDAGDVTKLVPPDLWSALQNPGMDFPDLGGVDMDSVQDELDRVRNTFTGLRKGGWPYIDEAFGGLGLSQGGKDSGGGGSNLFS